MTTLATVHGDLTNLDRRLSQDEEWIGLFGEGMTAALPGASSGEPPLDFLRRCSAEDATSQSTRELPDENHEPNRLRWMAGAADGVGLGSLEVGGALSVAGAARERPTRPMPGLGRLHEHQVARNARPAGYALG